MHQKIGIITAADRQEQEAVIRGCRIVYSPSSGVKRMLSSVKKVSPSPLSWVKGGFATKLFQIQQLLIKCGIIRPPVFDKLNGAGWVTV